VQELSARTSRPILSKSLCRSSADVSRFTSRSLSHARTRGSALIVGSVLPDRGGGAGHSHCARAKRVAKHRRLGARGPSAYRPAGSVPKGPRFGTSSGYQRSALSKNFGSWGERDARA
jgi:hypothetical protein